ncbi:MAG TPA: GGDEF domain-containing protein [Cellulomonas sp.]
MGADLGALRGHEHLPLLYARRSDLALALVVLGLLALGGGFWPLDPTTPVLRWFLVASLLLALSAALVLAPPRRWSMLVTLGTAVLGAGVLLASCQTSEGLVVVSVGLIAVAQFAVYAFPTPIAAAFACLCLAVITAGMALAPAPFHPISWFVVLVALVASTGLFNYVTHWLRRYASTDDLTGALTRGALMHRLDAELGAAHRTGSALAVVSVDVDQFKAINDTRGHLAGDEVLADLVRGWRGLLGRHDAVGRTGGDEFVLVLPGRDADAACGWLVDARAVAPAPWSAGLAVATPTDTVRDLLDRADVALYAAKSARTDQPT